MKKMSRSAEEKLILYVDRVLKGTPYRVRVGAYVKDEKNRVGRVISLHKSRKGKKWARVQFFHLNRAGKRFSRVRAIWCDDLRST
jgi:hypothetical protein